MIKSTALLLLLLACVSCGSDTDTDDIATAPLDDSTSQVVDSGCEATFADFETLYGASYKILATGHIRDDMNNIVYFEKYRWDGFLVLTLMHRQFTDNCTYFTEEAA